jgi:FixJ family two-component response regulator
MMPIPLVMPLAHLSLKERRLPQTPLISIVDDDGLVRESTKGLLRSMGYAAEAFTSAEEYLRSGSAATTACLISDLQMAGMNGADFQERLIAEGRHTPIIFVTAFPDERLRDRVMKAGAFGFLSKPFSDRSLKECLDRALQGGSNDPSARP